VPLKTVIVTQETVSTGIDKTMESILEIYPNPVTDELILRNTSANTSVSIFNSTGNLVVSKFSSEENDRINLTGLSRGLYIIKINDNGKIKTGKFIKQ